MLWGESLVERVTREAYSRMHAEKAKGIGAKAGREFVNYYCVGSDKPKRQGVNERGKRSNHLSTIRLVWSVTRVRESKRSEMLFPFVFDPLSPSFSFPLSEQLHRVRDIKKEV